MMPPLSLMVAMPVVVLRVFQVDKSVGLTVQAAIGVLGLGLLAWHGRRLARFQCAVSALALGLLNLHVIAAGAPLVETGLKRNQTLKPLGLALKQAWSPGITLVCWGRLPQGLPYYAQPVISPVYQPYLGG